jgi:predicted O-linked N-acetylglucosamine transferase (SPINDLY family)
MNLSSEQPLIAAIKCHLSGDILSAFELYADVLSTDPDNVTALINQGVILLAIEQPSDAAHLLKRAITLAPNDIEALNNYGNALQELGFPDQAIKQYEQAFALDNTKSDVTGNLGRALLRRGDYLAATKILKMAIRLDPEHTALRFIESLALPIIPENIDQLGNARKRMSSRVRSLKSSHLTISDPLNEIGMTNFYAAYQGQDDRKIQEQLADAYRRSCPALNFISPHINLQRKHKKIRVGFVSTHLGSHTIGKLNRALITRLNKDKFEIFVFCPGLDTRLKDNTINDLAAHVDQIFFPIPTLSDTRKIIVETALDILYYPDIGMEPLTYFLGFARLAPIQCVTWGHPVTTGLQTIDYFISSKLIETETAESNYTEKLVRLDSFSTDYTLPKPLKLQKLRTSFNLNKNNHLYVCPQSLFKFHPDFDHVLGEILRQDINGEIIILEGQHPEWASKLYKRFEIVIPDVTARIKFLPRLSGADYLHLISFADVILDTFYFSGGNTSYEAFALGKIVVTLPGKFAKGRLTLALYRQMGITEATAKTPKDYIKIALKFGLDKNARLKAEARIAAARNKIFDTSTALNAHEQFFLNVMNDNNL